MVNINNKLCVHTKLVMWTLRRTNSLLGIVGGRKTSLKPDKDFDYMAERKKERESRAGYKSHP